MPLDAMPPPFRRPLLPTPFAACALPAALLDRFIAWNGFSTVDVFTSAEQEYFAIRNTCGVYDMSPMAKYAITGADAEDFLDRLVTRKVRALRPGRVAYALWCDDDGLLVSDGTLFRLAADSFRLCAAEPQLDWLLASAAGFDVTITDETSAIAALAVQGPTSCAVLAEMGLAGLGTLKPFAWQDGEVEGRALTVSRTGFTGDLGYAVWIAPEHAAFLWDRLMQAGADRAIRPIGSQALNMARIETGLVMQNVEFVSAATASRIGGMRTPLQLGLDALVAFDKGHFNGRRALLAERARGVSPRLVGLDIEGSEPAHGALIYADRRCRREIGYVTSALWSPTCKRNIALALLRTETSADGQPLYIDLHLDRELERERRVVRARVTDRRFFAPERARRTPPAPT